MSTSVKGSIPHLDDLTICYDFSNPRQFDTSAAYNVHKRLDTTESATFTDDEIDEEVYKANSIIWEPWGSLSEKPVGARNLAANGKHDAWAPSSGFQTQINDKWYFELWDFLNQWPDNPSPYEDHYKAQMYIPSGLFEQKDVLGANRYYQGAVRNASTYDEDYGWFSEKTFADLSASQKKVDNSTYNPSDSNGLINGKPACRMFARIRILENNSSDTGALNRWEVYVRDDELINTDDTNHQLVPGMTVEVGDYGMWEIGPAIETMDYPTSWYSSTDRGGRWIYHCIRPTLTNNFPQPVHAIDKFLKPSLPLQPTRTPFIELNNLTVVPTTSTVQSGKITFNKDYLSLVNGVGNIEFNPNNFDEADCPSTSAWEMYLYEQNTGTLHSFHRKLLGDTTWTTMMGNHHAGWPNQVLPDDWGNANSSNPGITLQYAAYFYKLEHKRRDMFNNFSTTQKDTAWPGVIYPDLPNGLTGCHQKGPLYINEDLVIGEGSHLEEFSYFCWVKHRGHDETYPEARNPKLNYGNRLDFTLLSFSEHRFEFKVDVNYRLSLVALLGTNHGFPELNDSSKSSPSDHEYCDIKSPQIVKDLVQNGWVQLGFTYSQSNRQVKFYVNGELISTHTSTTTAGQNALKLGDYNSGTDIFTNSTLRRGFILGRPDNTKSVSWKTTANSSSHDRSDVRITSIEDIMSLSLNSAFMWKDRLLTDTEVASLYSAKAEMLGAKPVPAKVELPTQPSIMADAISGAVNSFTSDSSPASVVNALQGLGHKVWAIVDEDHCSGTDLPGQVPTADETTSGIQSLTAVGKFAKLYFDQDTPLGVTSGFADDELNGLPYMCIVGFDKDRYLGSSFIMFAEDQYGDYVLAQGNTPTSDEVVFQPTNIKDIIKQSHPLLGNNANFSNYNGAYLFDKYSFFIKGFTQDESGYNNVEYFDRSKKITVKKGTNEVQWHLCTDIEPGANGYHNSNEFSHNHNIAWAWSPDEQRKSYHDGYNSWFCGHSWMHDGRMRNFVTSDSHGPHSVVDYTPDNYEFWGLLSAADGNNINVNTYNKWGNYEISSTDNPTFYIIS